MITVRDAEDDKIEALEAGADDFVTKAVPLPRTPRPFCEPFSAASPLDDAPRESVLRGW